MSRLVLAFTQLLVLATPACASAGEGDPLPSVLLGLTVLLVAARLGSHFATRAGQPPVLGELIAGVAVGGAAALVPASAAWLSHSPALEVVGGIGVCLLLFEVGLESTVADMQKVGLPALLVACIGVAAPFALGWAVSAWMLPGHSAHVHAFLGAALTATSVGITARVLQEARSSQSAEARIILGAAVIDDVLGLLILALVAGAVRSAESGAPLAVATIATIIAKAIVFLAGFVVAGQRLVPIVFERAAHLEGHGVHLVLALAHCFFGAFLASAAGLAPIVGAYAAGLVLEPAHLRRFAERGEPRLEELLHTVSAFLVPVFFVLMGMKVDVGALFSVTTLKLGAGLVAAAIAGKLACWLVVPAGVDGLTVALGMIPRGEVGLIFANVGLSLTLGGHRLLDEQTVSALVLMVITTTLLTPPALRWALFRPRGGRAPEALSEPASAASLSP